MISPRLSLDSLVDRQLTRKVESAFLNASVRSRIQLQILEQIKTDQIKNTRLEKSIELSDKA